MKDKRYENKIQFELIQQMAEFIRFKNILNTFAKTN